MDAVRLGRSRWGRGQAFAVVGLVAVLVGSATPAAAFAQTQPTLPRGPLVDGTGPGYQEHR